MYFLLDLYDFRRSGVCSCRDGDVLNPHAQSYPNCQSGTNSPQLELSDGDVAFKEDIHRVEVYKS